MKRTIYLNLWN